MMKKGAYPTPLIFKEYNSPLIEKTRLLHLERKFPDNRKISRKCIKGFFISFFQLHYYTKYPNKYLCHQYFLKFLKFLSFFSNKCFVKIKKEKKRKIMNISFNLFFLYLFLFRQIFLHDKNISINSIVVWLYCLYFLL